MVRITRDIEMSLANVGMIYDTINIKLVFDQIWILVKNGPKKPVRMAAMWAFNLSNPLVLSGKHYVRCFKLPAEGASKCTRDRLPANRVRHGMCFSPSRLNHSIQSTFTMGVPRVAAAPRRLRWKRRLAA